MNYKLKYQNEIGEITFSIASGFVIEQAESLTSSTISFSTSQNPKGIGVNIDSQQIEAKSLSISGTIMGNATLARRKMINVISPMKKSLLIFNDELQIECYPKNTPDVEMYTDNPRFSFVLYIPYPYWQNETMEMVMLMGLEKNFKFPWNPSDPSPYRFSTYTQQAYTNVFNDGEYDTPWEMTFYAMTPLTNPKVENMETGEYIRLIKSFAAGDSIVVSTLDNEITVTCISSGGVKTDGFVYLDIGSEPFVLRTGDNLLKTTADTNAGGLTAVVRFRTAHSGVFL